jgi:hypothetical protein
MSLNPSIVGSRPGTREELSVVHIFVLLFVECLCQIYDLGELDCRHLRDKICINVFLVPIHVASPYSQVCVTRERQYIGHNHILVDKGHPADVTKYTFLGIRSKWSYNFLRPVGRVDPHTKKEIIYRC